MRLTCLSARRSRSSRENSFWPCPTRSPAFTYSCVTMPETAQLTSMFSDLASTSPTPATTCSKLEVGGAEGGTVGSRLGRVRAIEIIARIAATAATIGRTVLFMTESPSSRFSPFLRSVRSEEHTSELQSHLNLVCRLLLEKKKKKKKKNTNKKKTKKKKKKNIKK